MVCAPLFVVIRYSFVECAAPTILIRDHSLGASGFFVHAQNWARSSTYKCTRRKDARRTPDMRGERWTNARYTRRTRSAFVVCFAASGILWGVYVALGGAGWPASIGGRTRDPSSSDVVATDGVTVALTMTFRRAARRRRRIL